MTKAMWSMDTINHGRLAVIYEDGEIQAQYGVARELHDGTLEFLSGYSVSRKWSKEITFAERNPFPIHKLENPEGYRIFSVNFRSKKSPVRLLEKVNSYNWKIEYKGK